MQLMGTELMNQSVGAVRAVPLNFYIITYDLSAFLCSSNNNRRKYKTERKAILIIRETYPKMRFFAERKESNLKNI